MAKLRWHFQALLTKIEPSAERRHLAKTLPRELRTWLKEHDYETVDPHTLLSGSYARHTAILEIPDVDVGVPGASGRKSPRHPLQNGSGSGAASPASASSGASNARRRWRSSMFSWSRLKDWMAASSSRCWYARSTERSRLFCCSIRLSWCL
jgi:hypothetical protein